MRKYIADKYQILTDSQKWENITKRKARELIKSGDYKTIDLFDNDLNFIAEGLFFSPQVKQVEKFEDLEEGLNKLMNKYN
jgi:hypothetical protein